MPDGLLNVLKPPGMTSHDIVDGVRRVTRMRKVGHTGTLDPAAAGVMILMLGGATRLSEYLMGCDKTYRAEITFGLSTDTLDGEGVVVAEADAGGVTETQVREGLAGLTGEIEMVPPMHSAVWHEGRRLYEIAREGETVEVESRQVTVHRFDLLDFEPGERARAIAEVECSSGTYIRSLAAMLGDALDCPSYLSFLVRTTVGAQTVAEAATGRELVEAMREDRLCDLLQPPETVLCDWPTIEADRETAIQLCRGMQTPAPSLLTPGQHLLVKTEGRLLCVAEIVTDGEATLIQPRRVLLSEDEL
ncbi:MAG: tRNA pseudouridine(55) synthase TruB [Armatimonadia bacterium]|nr:tRNA pseudouridine(55) synthase TruB [Armatimonadia bacterium]